MNKVFEQLGIHNILQIQDGLVCTNPADASVIAHVKLHNANDLENAINNAEKAFQSWRQVPAPKRAEVIRLIANRLRELKDPLGTLVSIETGKLKQEGDGEVQEMIDIADFAIGQSRMLCGNVMQSERVQHQMYEQWHPLGPIGIISAFNFPVAVWAWNAFIAAICGDTMIWKPSPKAPLSALAVQKICDEVCKELGYDSIFQLIITDDNALVDKMVSDTRLPLISFTGSSAVGKIISEKVGARLGKCLLELSGNNAVVLDKTANLKLAIPSIVFGAVGTTGQRCTTTRRVFVHRSLKDNVIEQLMHAYQQVKIGNPLHEGVLMGPLIDDAAVNSFKNTMTELQNLGAEILTGGNVIDEKGYFVEPTIVLAKHDWDIVQRETFAPILYLIEFKTLDDAIEMHNAVPQGLSSAIFTQDVNSAQRFVSATGSDCGIANVNIGTSGAEIGGAFGGEKDTGGGREAGSDSWKAYMRRQTTTINGSEELPLAQGIQFNLKS